MRCKGELIGKRWNAFSRYILRHILLFFFIGSYAQTPGLIYHPSIAPGTVVLDPNGDGFSSISPNGFVSSDVTESEIPFVRIPPLNPEPTGDPRRGPNCGFTDLVDSGTGSGLSVYLSGNNLMFRFKIGNSITGSKGYAVMVDADEKMGNTGANADPNFIGGVKGNPGFEFEIVLETNFRVALYDADGTTSPTRVVSLPVDQYSQQSIALTTVCGNPDYFYDFYMPFDSITAHFPSVNTSTPLRFVGVTVISPQDAIGGPASDTYGVPDSGAWNAEWTLVTNSQPPVCASCLGSGYPPPCSDAPVVSSPINGGATSVSGTSSEANGTRIRLYKNGILIDSTTVSGGAWTVSGISPALTGGDTITAKAQATGESACLFSNEVFVSAGCSSPPTISCLTKKGAQGSGPSGAPVGTTINIYQLTSTGRTLAFTVLTVSGNTWLYDCSGGSSGCTGGINCINPGTYFATATEPGHCESAASNFMDLNCGSASTAPTVTTNPVYDFATAINGTSSTATGIVYLFVNGTYTDTAIIASSSWSFTGLSLVSGDTLTFHKIDGTNCMSAATTVYVRCQAGTPVVDSPISNGATSVSGTSSEAAGTGVRIYKNGASIGTTTVAGSGTWVLTGIFPALVAGDNITAKQKSSACGGIL